MMRYRHNKTLLLLMFFGLLLSSAAFAGNKDRIGQNGANELSINPWTRSSGFANANSTSVIGLESIASNISGLAFTPKTEIQYGFSRFMGGASNINTFGLAQKVGEGNVIGFSIMNMAFGDINVTTEDNPEGGIGVYASQFLNLNLAYARAFSNSIYAGVAVKVISEAITDVKTQGVAFDIGIRYVTGKDDNLKFGIALRNIGPKLKFEGNGLSVKTDFNGNEFTFNQRSEAFEMPAELNMGVAYDIYVGAASDTTGKSGKTEHRITPAGTFVSKSFGKDELRVGAEYAWREMVMARVGLLYQEGIFSTSDRTTMYTGPSAGLSFVYPINENGTSIAIDYSYVFTNPYGGNHMFGLRLNL